MPLVGCHYCNKMRPGVPCLGFQESRRLTIVFALRRSQAVDGLDVEARGVLRSV
jgi:hypothetical protein